jgi:hypothetical protein
MNVAGNAMVAIAAQKYSDGDRGLLSEVCSSPLVCSAIVAVAERITRAWVSLASD